MRTAFVALTWMLLSADPSVAQDKPVMSSQEEYRSCLDDGDRLEDDRLQFELAQRRLESAQKDLQTLVKTHVATGSAIYRGDKKSVERFNAMADQLNDVSRQLNDQAIRLLAKQGEFNARIASANRRCAGMTIRTEDQQAVLLERVKRAAAN